MIIYIEGLSCSGKSTFIELISKASTLSNNILAIPEFADYPDKTKIDFELNNDYCKKNDEKKTSLANSSEKEIILVDRCHASTLAYNFASSKVYKDDEYGNILNWYIQSLAKGKLLKPDLYVLLKCSEQTVIDRAKKIRVFNKNIAWYSGTKFAEDFYDNFFEYFEPEVPLLIHNVEKGVEAAASSLIKRLENG